MHAIPVCTHCDMHMDNLNCIPIVVTCIVNLYNLKKQVHNIVVTMETKCRSLPEVSLIGRHYGYTVWMSLQKRIMVITVGIQCSRSVTCWPAFVVTMGVHKVGCHYLCRSRQWEPNERHCSCTE